MPAKDCALGFPRSQPRLWQSHTALPAGFCGASILACPRREMLELPVSQDGFYRLDAGRVDFVDGG